MKFDIGTVLSISHGRLLTDIGNVYKILNYMLDDNFMTHQLPRAGRFAEKFLLAKYPDLKEWDAYSEQITTENWKSILPEAEKIFGKELEVEKVPTGVWTHKNPIKELEEMVGKDKIITVRIDPTQPQEESK